MGEESDRTKNRFSRIRTKVEAGDDVSEVDLQWIISEVERLRLKELSLETALKTARDMVEIVRAMQDDG